MSQALQSVELILPTRNQGQILNRPIGGIPALVLSTLRPVPSIRSEG
jgi:hypothetical protein